MGFAGVSVKPLVGKDGAMLVTFASNLAGLKEAVRLAELLEAEGHGRAQWVHARGLPPSFVGGSDPMFVKVDDKDQTSSASLATRSCTKSDHRVAGQRAVRQAVLGRFFVAAAASFIGVLRGSPEPASRQRREASDDEYIASWQPLFALVPTLD